MRADDYVIIHFYSFYSVIYDLISYFSQESVVRLHNHSDKNRSKPKINSSENNSTEFPKFMGSPGRLTAEDDCALGKASRCLCVWMLSSVNYCNEGKRLKITALRVSRNDETIFQLS